MLSSRDCPGALSIDVSTRCVRKILSDVSPRRVWEQCHVWNCLGISCDKRPFTLVPNVKQFLAWGCADKTLAVSRADTNVVDSIGAAINS
jgi:hypothetical protein